MNFVLCHFSKQNWNLPERKCNLQMRSYSEGTQFFQQIALIQADLLDSRSGILKNVIPDPFSNSFAQFITQLTGIVPEETISLTHYSKKCCLTALFCQPRTTTTPHD